MATGKNVFAGFRFTMRPIHLQDDEDGVMPRAVLQLLQEQPEIRTHFLSALNTYLEDGGLSVSKVYSTSISAIPAEIVVIVVLDLQSRG